MRKALCAAGRGRATSCVRGGRWAGSGAACVPGGRGACGTGCKGLCAGRWSRGWLGMRGVGCATRCARGGGACAGGRAECATRCVWRGGCGAGGGRVGGGFGGVRNGL